MSGNALKMLRAGLLGISLCALLAGCGSEARGAGGAAKKRVLVIGMDGMDATLFKQMMDQGRLPNFSKLAARGGFSPLATAMPPQSPVAWANFISGSHPGKHQIYDFIHRDPNPPGKGVALGIYQSISKQQQIKPAWYNPLKYTDWEGIPWGRNWRLPLGAEETISMRRGDNFWDYLTARDIDTVVYRVPANYPPDDANGSSNFSCISGMGTPELRGGDGSFTRYDEDAPLGGSRPGGGQLVKLFLSPERHSTKCTIEGPENFLQKPNKRGGVDLMETTFDLVRDPVDDVAKITLNDQVIVLRKGEWSEWTPVTFETGLPVGWLASMLTVPTSASGMVRFKLLSVHPKLALFMSPVHFDPLDPASPISFPPEFATEVAEDLGRYHTTGIPQEHKALRHGALDEDSFLEQTQTVLDERTAQYRRALAQFDSGCLFFYFGATDLLGHMFWRDRDPGHPGLRLGEAEKYGKVIEDCYVKMDGLVGEALAALDRDDDTLIVMSDHGFGSFRRQFNLNTWLVQEGYMVVYDRAGMHQSEYRKSLFINVDWTQTKAYALGINSLYINTAGREKNGIVPESERLALTKEIGEKMLLVRDENGDPAIRKYYITEQVYPGADPAIAPDMLVGYAKNFRASWSTALGGMPQELIQDNLARWSGDHCVAADLVPGIIVTNRKLGVDDPKLEDVAPTILQEFGVAVPDTMTGRPLFSQN